MRIGERRSRHDVNSDDDSDIGNKKRRGPVINEIENRLESLILRVGDKSATSLEHNLEGLVQVLKTDLDTYKNKIFDIIKYCVTGKPDKVTIYSTLVGLLNAQSHNFGAELVEILMKQLRDELITQNFDNALRVIVFLADLVNSRVVSANSCMGFLEGLVEVAFQDDTPQVRSDWFVYSVLSSLPFAGRELNERKGAVLTEMLAVIEKFIASRSKLHLQMLTVWTTHRPHLQEDYLDCLWAQIRQLKADKWREGHIPRVYLSFEGVLSGALQHALPCFIPVGHQETSVYPLPSVIFRLFDYTDCPENGPILPGAHSIERFLVEKELEWIIDKNNTNRKNWYHEMHDKMKFKLLHYDRAKRRTSVGFCHFSHLHSASALLNHGRGTKIPLNYVILEVVFGQLFKLPEAPYNHLFYGSLLIELCKFQPNTMPQVLAQAAELFYQRVETMLPACIDRLVDWFSYHLSNFQFRWSWTDWEDCLNSDELAPKQMFAREVLTKCMRFSYHQRVTDIVPKSYALLLPEKPEIHFKYADTDDDTQSDSSIAHQMAQAIRNKCSPEECPNPEEMSGVNPLAIDIFVSVLLNLGSKSFSHSFAALTRYHKTLKTLTEGNEDAQLAVLRTLYQLWNSHQQMMVVLVDKLLKMQIVECNTVAAWIFGDDMKHELLRMWIWEILLGALVTLNTHVQRLHSDLECEQNSFDKDSNSQETEEKAKEMAHKLQGGEEFQKNLLLSIFHKLTVLLSEHLLTCESEGKDYQTNWYKWIRGRFKQIFLTQSNQVWKLSPELETSLFTNDIDPHILEIFHQFRTLRR